jgi:cobalt-zinc-cadmium efflux system outer membrane protein
MKKLLLYTCSMFGMSTGFAQNTVDVVVRQVEVNNKSILTNKKYWEAKQSEFKTGLTPYDPQVEYDYLFGSPADAGNQQDFSITQRLDFPTAYKRRRELSGQQIAQTGLQQQVFRQDVLLEAKLLTLEMIYLNKRKAELDRRLQGTDRLVEDYHKKLERGDVIILDVNKAKLQLLSITNEVKLNENERQNTLTRLAELNGGIPIVISDTLYPELPVIPDFNTLDSMIEANDPILKVYQKELEIWQKQIAVQKALNLPKIETGYHSQGILGQSYRGMHAGITIPLWENKNRVNAAKANLEYARSNAETHVLAHRLENKQYYDRLAVRWNMMQEYKSLLSTLDNTALLDKALALGQITIIQYFYDVSFYFAAYDRYLQAEWEYHQDVARLFRFQL